jgi:hypothetical protein
MICSDRRLQCEGCVFDKTIFIAGSGVSHLDDYGE